MSREKVTVEDLVRQGASQFDEAELFFGHGTDNAWDEAACLVFDGLGLAHENAERLGGLVLDEKQQRLVLELFARRIGERKPAPYLTGKAWFCGLPFKVDDRVLIPRSPIAELIEAGFSPWLEPDKIETLLDLCTGGGCIAIASALTLPGARVTGSDLSADALCLARDNAKIHGVEGQVSFVHSDLFAAITEQTFDIIVSNPPYVAEKEWADLPDEYRHEPGLGLAAGKSGLDIVERILVQAPAMLNPGGALIVEVGARRPQLESRYPDWPFTWLEFSRGGEGVFLLYREQLLECLQGRANVG